jgi:pSer/pThr/pTyr-binding forkhead associated (FHA) protein/peptidoglycan hydrolase CwlO-like protein
LNSRLFQTRSGMADLTAETPRQIPAGGSRAPLGGSGRFLVLQPAHPRPGQSPLLLDRQEISIGSEAGCDLSLTNGGVAPRHAVIASVGHQTVVRASDRRTWLNGFPVTESILRNGDVLAIGPAEFRLRHATADELPSEQPTPTPGPAIVTRAIEKPQRQNPQVANHEPDFPALQVERLSLESLRRELESRRAGVEAGLADLAEERACFEAARAQFESDWSELEAISVSLEGDRAQLASEQAELEKQRLQIAADRSRFMNELDALAVEQKTQEDIASARRNLEMERRELEKFRAEIDADCENLQTERQELESQRSRNDAELRRREAERSQRDAAQEQLDADQSRLASEQRSLEFERKELQALRRELELQRTRLESQRAESEAERLQWEADRPDAESVRDDLDTARIDLETERRELEAYRAELEAGRLEFESERAEFDLQRSDFESQRVHLASDRTQLETAKKAIAANQEEHAAARKRCDDADAEWATERAKIRAEIESDRAAIESERLQFTAETERLADEQSELETRRAEFELERRQLADERAQLDVRQSQLECDREQLERRRLDALAGPIEAEVIAAEQARAVSPFDPAAFAADDESRPFQASAIPEQPPEQFEPPFSQFEPARALGAVPEPLKKGWTNDADRFSRFFRQTRPAAPAEAVAAPDPGPILPSPVAALEPSPTNPEPCLEECIAAEQSEVCQSVADYMQQLLARNPAARSRAEQPALVHELAAPAVRRRESASAAAPAMAVMDAPADIAPVPVEIEELQPVASRRKHDVNEIRAGVGSLREIANLSARTAVAAHSSRRLRKAVVLMAPLTLASFVLAGGMLVLGGREGLYVPHAIGTALVGVLAGTALFSSLMTARRKRLHAQSAEKAGSADTSDPAPGEASLIAELQSPSASPA